MKMRSITSISELTYQIKSSLESNFANIAAKGEISNFKRQASGHIYFSLKDSGAQISAVMFKGNTFSLGRFPKNGDKVIAYGELSVYPPRGNYQIIVRKMDYDGLGDYLLKLEELKQRLSSLGWFDSAHKKSLPAFPNKIGVITSPTGAAIKDIINVLTRRFQGFHLIINPVQVQGTSSGQEITRAIEELNRHQFVDVIILGRGGGSIEDLASFNEEIVAKAIFDSRIPIISAVGHETDHTIADYIADLRAPTPSAAAELVIKEQKTHLDNMEKLNYIMKQEICSQVNYELQRLDHLMESLNKNVHLSVQKHLLKIEYYGKIISELNPLNKIKSRQQILKHLNKTMIQSIIDKKNKDLHRLKHLIELLDSINPKNLLQKGYAIIFNQEKVVRSTSDVKKNQSLKIMVSDGTILTKVTEVE